MAAARDGDVELRGGRLGHAGRRDAGARRGRDPGHAAARDRGRAPRRARRRARHGADARAASPRATRASWPRAIQDLRREAGLELDDRIDLWVGSASRRASRPICRRSPPTPWPTLADGDPPGRRRRRPTVELDGGRRHDRRCVAGAGDAMSDVPIGEAAARTAAADGRGDGRAAGALARLRRHRGRGRRRRPADQGLARRERRRPARSSTSSATTCGSIFSQNSGALFGLFRDQRARVRASPRWSSSA